MAFACKLLGQILHMSLIMAQAAGCALGRHKHCPTIFYSVLVQIAGVWVNLTTAYQQLLASWSKLGVIFVVV